MWDTSVSSTYMKNMISGYLSDVRNENLVEAAIQTQKAKTQLVHTFREDKMSSGKIPRKCLSEESQTCVPSKMINSRLAFNKSIKQLRAISKNRLDPSRPPIKPSVSASSVHRLPLQRFAESLKGSNTFSKEHPNLELDMSAKQTTLFPRRFRRGTENSSPGRESINLAEASTKSPDAAASEKQKTWKEVLSKNQPAEKLQRVLPPRNFDSNCEVVSDPEIQAMKGVDIISTPANGLFQIERETERLSKQKKCKFQRFPVMYIRPEYQVQQLANIYIQGDNDNNCVGRRLSSNVKYLECVHEEDNPQERSSLRVEREPKPQFETSNDSHIQENKYFKALGIPTISKCPSIRTESSSSLSSSTESHSREALPSSTSSSPPKAKKSSNSSSDDVKHLIENIFFSSDEPQPTPSKEFIRNCLSTQRREAYVQTENVPANPYSPPRALREVFVQTDNKADTATSPPPIADTLTHATSAPTEDDIISNIFNRIRNDIPSALQEFKNRNITPRQEGHPPSTHPLPKQNQEQTQPPRHQMSTINNLSNVEIEARLSCDEAKPCTTFELPVPSPSNPPSRGERSKFLLQQQNPLFVQTINKIKSTAVHEAMPTAGEKKDDRYKYPADAEIKRAVEIFLGSLTLEGCSSNGSNGRKSITRVCGKSRLTKIISSIYSSSSTSGSSSEYVSRKKANKVVLSRDLSRSSESLTRYSSSNMDTGSSVATNSRHLQSTKMTESSLSDGEVLSMGEV